MRWTRNMASPAKQAIKVSAEARRAAFAQEYVANGADGSAAAITAGYAPASAAQQASRLLADKRVVAMIASLQRDAALAAGIRAKDVIDEIAIGAFADLTDYVTWDSGIVKLRPSAELDARKRRAVVSIKQGQWGIEIKLMDKLGALTKLGQHLGVLSGEGGDADAEKQAPMGFIVVPAKEIQSAIVIPRPPSDGDTD